MYRLDLIYGHKAYRAFADSHGWPKGKGTPFREKPRDVWNSDPICVHSYSQLIDVVSFFGIMNKRLNLYFRGQSKHWELEPTIFRSQWRSLCGTMFTIPQTKGARIALWNHLNDAVSALVLQQCAKYPMPRENTLKMFREARWAVAQHYELWPTPLIDITQNLRIAASFALFGGRKEGMLYIVGMPASMNSITFDADQHIVLARLNAVCPTTAKRPHYQDGFLVGRFPFESPITNQIDSDPQRFSNLKRRLIAKIKLIDDKDSNSGDAAVGSKGFWSEDFPPISESALLPSADSDVLLAAFKTQMPTLDQKMTEICSRHQPGR